MSNRAFFSIVPTAKHSNDTFHSCQEVIKPPLWAPKLPSSSQESTYTGKSTLEPIRESFTRFPNMWAGERKQRAWTEERKGVLIFPKPINKTLWHSSQLVPDLWNEQGKSPTLKWWAFCSADNGEKKRKWVKRQIGISPHIPYKPVNYLPLTRSCQDPQQPVNFLDLPQSAPCYPMMFHVYKDRRLQLFQPDRT